GGDVRVQGGFLLLDGGLHTTLQVDGGQAIVNGLQTGLTTIGAGGKLSGAGTLANTTVAGTVAPGNSIGTLTINGNYVQTASGVYEAELAANGSADLLRVTGSAAPDGTLRLFASAGQYRLGQSYTLLTAGGGVSGR
ncbi:autotransporter outer membrane beta-barrel domain-containing protein, partial [Acinetobacter baumannii]|nr:autotransporter outer membrane beta-barrel domain-containing protein [Acinetobacter baumannii]